MNWKSIERVVPQTRKNKLPGCLLRSPHSIKPTYVGHSIIRNKKYDWIIDDKWISGLTVMKNTNSSMKRILTKSFLK